MSGTTSKSLTHLPGEGSHVSMWVPPLLLAQDIFARFDANRWFHEAWEKLCSTMARAPAPALTPLANCCPFIQLVCHFLGWLKKKNSLTDWFSPFQLTNQKVLFLSFKYNRESWLWRRSNLVIFVRYKRSSSQALSHTDVETQRGQRLVALTPWQIRSRHPHPRHSSLLFFSKEEVKGRSEHCLQLSNSGEEFVGREKNKTTTKTSSLPLPASLQYAPPQTRSFLSDPTFSFPDGCLSLSK